MMTSPLALVGALKWMRGKCRAIDVVRVVLCTMVEQKPLKHGTEGLVTVMKDEELMLVCAVRYSLGRRSYIVGVTCGYVASICKKLSPNCISIIIRDIEETMEMYHRSGRMCGMECDEKDWYRLLEVLKEGDSDGKAD